MAAFALTASFGLLASCSDDKKDSGSGSISKTEFLAQGNALCATFNAEMEAAQATIASDEDAVVFLSDTLVPGLRALLRSIEDLGYPEGDAEHIQGLIDDTDDVLDQVAADPEGYAQATSDPFAEINAQLRD